MIIERRHDVAASHLINAHTHGIVREDDNGPVEEVSSSRLQAAIARALADAEARGKVEGLTEVRALMAVLIRLRGVSADQTDGFRAAAWRDHVKRMREYAANVVENINARISALSEIAAKREDGV